MPLISLLAKIERDAVREGEALLAEARRRAEEIIKEAEKRAEEAIVELNKEYEEISKQRCVSEMSDALNYGKSELLRAQEMLLSETVEEAKRRFENYPPEKYKEWLRALIINHATGTEKIIASRYDRVLFEDGLLRELNCELEKKGKRGGMWLSDEEPNFRRGIILCGEKTRENLTLDKIVEEIVREIEADLLTMLFGELDMRGGTMRTKFRCTDY